MGIGEVSQRGRRLAFDDARAVLVRQKGSTVAKGSPTPTCVSGVVTCKFAVQAVCAAGLALPGAPDADTLRQEAPPRQHRIAGAHEISTATYGPPRQFQLHV